ncbi:hypothetical protein N9149_03705, partial [Akkermansiaceae bacterium]|nr:hypothetical protein [Akkermansiaceae bacterium]
MKTRTHLTPRPTAITAGPDAVAKGLAHLPGLVFFDTAGNLPTKHTPPISIIGARPTEIIRGHLSDPSALDNALKKQALSLAPDYGFPTGGACGAIDYDGSFTFGIYPELLIFITNPANGGRSVTFLAKSEKLNLAQILHLGPGKIRFPKTSSSKLSKRSKNTSQLEIFTKSISPAASAQNAVLQKDSFFCTINFVIHLLLPTLLISILLAEKFSHPHPRLFFASPALKSRPDQLKGHAHALL